MTTSAAALLGVWERGAVLPPPRRGLALLTAAEPGTPAPALAELSIGARDARLLRLRAEVFGKRFTGLAACPVCGERVEFDFDETDITIPTPPAPATQPPAEFPGEASGVVAAPSAGHGAGRRAGPPGDGEVLRVGEHEVRVRLLTCLDLEMLAMGSVPELGDARALLLRRCVRGASRGGEPVAVEELPEAVIDAVEAWLAASDPQADVRLLLSCPACAENWQQGFDIASFLWAEVDAWARRLLNDVHRLATAYGWSERDILDMSPIRRQSYLNLVRA